MRVELEFYEPPSDRMENLGRFMDDLVQAARSGDFEQRKHLLDLGLLYLPALADKDPDALKEHLVGCEVWRWLGDLPVFRTRGEPCVFFTVVEYENPAEIRIHALGAALRPSDPDPDLDAGDAWDVRILARCRSLELCD